MEDKQSLFSEKRYVGCQSIGSQSGHVVSKYLQYCSKPVLLLFIILHLSDFTWPFWSLFLSLKHQVSLQQRLDTTNEQWRPNEVHLVKFFSKECNLSVYNKTKMKNMLFKKKAILTKGVEYGGILMAIHDFKCILVIVNVLKCLYLAFD